MPLSKKAHEILNRPDLIAKRDMWFDRVQKVFDGRESEDEWLRENVLNISGPHIPRTWAEPSNFPEYAYTQPERYIEDRLEQLAACYEALENEYVFRPLVLMFRPYETHYVDKLMGADVCFEHDQWYTKQLTTPIGHLKMPELEQHEVWSLTKRAVDAFLAADVALPLFSIPIIASPLNVAVNLYGGEILMELMEDPDNAMKDFQIITDLQCELHRRFRGMVPEEQLQCCCASSRTQPPGYGQICGCTTQLISGEMYAEYIAPLDDKLLAVYPNGGMIHLCGHHTQHLDVFRNMKHLRSIQMNDAPTQDLKRYFDALREDQVFYFNLNPTATLETAMDISGGKRLIVIGGPLEMPIRRRLD